MIHTTVLARRQLNDLIERWVEYREMIERYKGKPEATEEQERALLALEARIASRLPLLLKSVPSEVAQEARSQMGGMRELLTRHRTLRTAEVPANVREMFLRSWHVHYLFLNQLKGLPLGGGKSGNLTPPPRSTPGPLSGLPRHLGGGGWLPVLFSWIVRLGILALIVFVIVRVLGVHRGEDGRLALQQAGEGGDYTERLRTAVQSLWGGATGWLQPVTATYGLVVTLILVGILLTSLIYFVFVRTR
ncbi:MAG: hypothetical protein QUU85_11930 [Candidatus Eisenbacteria bacterium]|nr:hypothetical protein [Candidatus Eisenbacteria bacterium]